MTIFYVLAAVIIVGFTTLIWRRLQGSDDWDRDASFFVDVFAMGATALIVGILAFNQLQAAPDGEVEELAQSPVVTEVAPTEEIEVTEDATPESTPTKSATATKRATRAAEATSEATEEASATAEPSETPEPTEAADTGTQTYTVKSGDRLANIATAYGVSVDDIVAANPGLDIDNLSIGQEITIPTGSAPDGTPEPASGSSSSGSSATTYTVQSGDYLNTIAEQFGVTAAEIVAANPGLDSDNLQVGQVLTIP